MHLSNSVTPFAFWGTYFLAWLVSLLVNEEILHPRSKFCEIKACPIVANAVAGSRDESHALCTHVDEDKENVVHVPVKRGSITVHDERVVHGSGANKSNVSAMQVKAFLPRFRRLIALFFNFHC